MTRKKDLFNLIKEQGNLDYEYKFNKDEDDFEELNIDLDEEEK